MTAYATRVRQAANASFNHEVAEVFRAIEGLSVTENVRKFGSLKLARENGDEIGDVDVLVVSLTAQVLLLLETKDFELARTPAELANELEKLLEGDKSAAHHHEERVAFTKNRLEEVLGELRLTGSPARWHVVDAIVTSHDLITAHFPALEGSRNRPRIVGFDDLVTRGPESLLSRSRAASSGGNRRRRRP